MHILLIGGTGFSGLHVVRQLAQMGHEITVFHRGETDVDLPNGVMSIQGNRRHLAKFAEQLKHLAPQVVVDMIPSSQQDAQNVMNIFGGVVQRVVAISSQDVYRAYGRLIGIESGPVEPIPLTEDSPLRQKLYPYRERVTSDHHLYNYEKILVEKVYMEDPQLPGTILRFPMVYGPEDRQHRLFAYLKRMDDNRSAILLDQGMADWRWTKGYVENVASAVTLAATNERAAGRIYNVGEREALTEAEWVRAIGKTAGWNGKIVVVPRKLGLDRLVPDLNTDQHLVADTTRIKEELGYVELVPQEEALSRTIAWERTHPPKEIDPKMFDYVVEDAILKEIEGNHS